MEFEYIIIYLVLLTMRVHCIAFDAGQVCESHNCT